MPALVVAAVAVEVEQTRVELHFSATHLPLHQRLDLQHGGRPLSRVYCKGVRRGSGGGPERVLRGSTPPDVQHREGGGMPT
eukprot:4889475-Pyramimonas_sp.AAC.2